MLELRVSLLYIADALESKGDSLVESTKSDRELEDLPPFVFVDDDPAAVCERERESRVGWESEELDLQFEHFKAVWAKDMKNMGHGIVDVSQIEHSPNGVRFALDALYGK